VVVAVVVLVAYVLWIGLQDWLMKVWIADAAVLVLPHWFSGIRRILKNDPLVIKVENLLAIIDLWENVRQDGEVLTVQMEVCTGKSGEIPKDAKLILRPGGADDTFLGLQVQVTINNVQGKDYPYLYCVLVARHEFGLLDRLDLDPPTKIIAEPKREEQVDIVVIRQHTTKQSGYHTKRSACARIFTYALTETRRLFPSA